MPPLASRKPRKKKPARCRPARKRKVKKSGYGHDVAEVAAKKRKKRAKACRPKAKRRKPAPRTKAPARKPAPPKPAPPQPVPAPPRTSTPPPPGADSPTAVYSGPFGKAQAERLLWRAGFGPSPGHAEALAAGGLAKAVESLVNPAGAETFTGAAPKDNSGNPLSPEDAWGHDHLFWLDRMVRTNQPLRQRMALIWHDWFATSDEGVGSQRLMLEQYELFRRTFLGSFSDLVKEVTADGAMLVWLNGIDNRRNAINENYARELMELFTLGADRGAYTESDVRQLARCLTGWRGDWSSEQAWHNFRYDGNRWDSGQKTVFGKTGAFGWEDACRLCVEHAMHPSFFVTKLWGYFIANPPSDADRQKLEQAYVASGYRAAPVVRAILLHPQLYEGPRMVKPPVVFNAGLLRALRRPVDRNDWVWLGEQAGQQLFRPPDVSGWDDSRWLDTSTLRGRWQFVQYALGDRYIGWGDPMNAYDGTETAEAALQSALAIWGQPSLTAESRASLLSFASSCLPASMADWQKRQYRAQRQNALRQLIGAAPDLQTS